MNIFQRWIAPCLALLLMAASVVWAQSSPYTSSAIQAVPPNITARDFPAMMMLAASRDHTLFGPMYTDYEDLTGSGKIDPTFRPDFDYYGYFDSSKCYGHDGDKFVPGGFRDGARSCSALGAARWSGNFLNWATMTRIDVVRKMLYGGRRSTDTADTTVLELAQLGTDAHAFAKYYRGTDIAKYTPFSTDELTKDGVYAGLTTCAMSTTSDATTGTPILRMAKGNLLLWSTSAKRVCRWRPYESKTHTGNADFWFGTKLVKYFERDAAIVRSDLQGTPAHAEIAPYPNTGDLPPGIGADGLAIRVKVCVDGQIGAENCKRFDYDKPDRTRGQSLKPSGILLDYGYAATVTDAARAEFGLVSGSYDNNLSGGMLRKNIGNLNDEIQTNGVFCHNTAEGCTGGIIKSFDVFRLYGAGAPSYTTASGFRWVMPSALPNKLFPSWGNPIGEMLIEALSYFSNKGASAYSDVAIDAALGLPRPDWLDPLNDDLSVTGAGGKTRGQIYGKSVCRPMNMLAVSSSSLSFDRDEVSRFDSLPNLGADTLATLTDKVGDREGITPRSVRSVASNDGGWGEQCTGKEVTHLWQVSGICPQAPATKGSYLSAGAALYGNTRAIRTTEGDDKDIPGFKTKSLPSDLPGYALRVRTMAAAMGGGVARIEVVDPSSGAKAYITPESIWDVKGKVPTGSPSTWLPGAMLTIKLLNSVTTGGKTTAASYVVTWNDAQFGGDYDMDIVGYISYVIEGGPEDRTVKVTTDILNVDGGMPGSHGFSITGGVKDAGHYITHGSHWINYGDCARLSALLPPSVLSAKDYGLRCGYDDAGMPLSAAVGAAFDNWTWPTRFDADEVNFVVNPTSSTRSFRFDKANTGSVLEDPLWYAAKYGSFSTGEDKFAAVSAATLPDAKAAAEGYFLARDPAKLELGLRKALDKILAAGNSTPAVSTAQLVTTSLKYVAEFDAKSHSGTVKAYQFADSSFKKEPLFNLGDKLTGASSRQVITNVGLIGTPLTVGELGAATPTALASARAALRKEGDPDGDSWQEMVNYVRGGAATGDLRKRLTNVLGPIVNAAPWLQRGALLRTTDVDLPTEWASYRDFALTRIKDEQPSVLWVASNDSLLHAFKADDGTPLMSYLPSPLMGGLRAASAESTKDIVATMDGSPVTADVYVGEGESGAWKTYLFSSLGRGGRALFALDVTDPAALTEDNAANVFKWMFSAEDDGDLGHILVDPVVHRASGQPSQVVRLNTGRFALMTPNGYGSSSGVAALFFLDVQGRQSDGTWGGGRVKKLVAKASDSGNGMMGATWVDIDNNGTADWVYATDLKGQLWKFDISSSDMTKWASSFVDGAANAPMFQAQSGASGSGDPLPITTAPVVTFPGMGGVMIGFGTGKSIVAGDFPNTSQTQRFYSIWDRGNFGPASVGTPGAADSKRAMPTHASLLGRKLVRDVKTGAVTFHADSEAATINWNDQDGWYLDFPVTPGQESGTGEMVLSTPVVRSGILFFTTVWPDSTGEDRCQTDPFASLYAVSPTGGSVVKGLLPSGVGMSVSDSKVLVVLDQTVGKEVDEESLRIIPPGDDDISLKAPTSSGRVQWRVIPGLKTH